MNILKARPRLGRQRCFVLSSLDLFLRALASRWTWRSNIYHFYIFWGGIRAQWSIYIDKDNQVFIWHYPCLSRQKCKSRWFRLSTLLLLKRSKSWLRDRIPICQFSARIENLHKCWREKMRKRFSFWHNRILQPTTSLISPSCKYICRGNHDLNHPFQL